jgi:HEAT repeat protein
MGWLLVVVLAGLVIFLCARQRPCWPFFVAAVVGGGPGAICAISVFRQLLTPGELALLSAVVPAVGAIGGAAGACAAMAIVGSCIGPREQVLGGLLGGVAAAVVGPSLMLLVPQLCFEGIEDFGFVAGMTVVTLVGVFVGSRLGRAYPQLRRARRRVAMGILAAVVVAGVAHLGLRADAVRAHVRSIRQLREAGDFEGMSYKVAHPVSDDLGPIVRDICADMDPIAALRHSDRRVRSRAAAKLGQSEDQRTLRVLIQVLQERRGAEREAVNALQKRADPQAVPAIAGVLDDGPIEVRVQAATLLGRLRDSRAVPALVRALRAEADAELPVAAAEALGEIGDRRAVPGLLETLRRDHRELAEKTADALRKIDDERIAPALVRLVADEDAGTRARACLALMRIGDPRAVQPLREVLRGRQGYGPARQALDRLAALDMPEAQAIVRQHNLRQQKLTREIGELKRDGDAVGLILHLFEGADGDRPDAGRALGELRDKRGVPALICALRYEAWRTREAAAEALGAFHDAHPVEPLAQALRDPLAHGEAAEALAQIGTRQARAALAEYARSKHKPSWWGHTWPQGEPE